MIQRLADLRAAKGPGSKSRWRWLGYLLTLAAVAYVLSTLARGSVALAEIDWLAFGPASLAGFGIYLLSLLIQFTVWSRLISFHRPVDWQDLGIYSRMLLTRRLPGGIWHWIGRAAMYSAATDIPTRVVLKGNFLEWGLLLLVAAAIHLAQLAGLPAGLRLACVGLLLAFALYLAWAWQPRQRPRLRRLIEAAGWVSLCAASWILGGVILYLFLAAAGADYLNGLEALRLWVMAGGMGLLISVVPAALGIQEVTLTVVMQPTLAPPVALLVAVLIRLLFTLADVTWGMAGWLLSTAVTRRRLKHAAR